jgi:hypothetical protein
MKTAVIITSEVELSEKLIFWLPTPVTKMGNTKVKEENGCIEKIRLWKPQKGERGLLKP